MKWPALALGLILWAPPGTAAAEILRIERRTVEDRALLLSAGVQLVYEYESGFLALADGAGPEDTLRRLGYDAEILDHREEGATYAVAGLRDGWSPDFQRACGEVLRFEENLAFLRFEGDVPEECVQSPRWFFQILDFRPLALPDPPPPEYAERQRRGEPLAVTPKPLVQSLVDSLDPSTLSGAWDAVIGGRFPNTYTTRHSLSSGCQTAVQGVFDEFAEWGLSPSLQDYRAGYAPNVIGTLTGRTNPERVYIVIGHLDDMPSSGAAPGADDNASGAAVVTAAARAMAPYAFANTVKFIACTGEEQGLYGSAAYADDAQARGEQIQAVLNADMIGWQGDGSPAAENLDLNYNASSQWLGLLFADCASAYATGCPVDAFSCASLTASDHYPFWQKGWSAVCGITDNEGYCSHAGHYPYYHTSNDTRANCGSPGFFYSAVKAYVATLAHLADPLCGPPAVPTGVSATPAGENRVEVAWTPGGGGLTYRVLRTRGGCASGEEALVLGETASAALTDEGASGGVPYAYRIQALDATGHCLSAPSDCAEAVTTGPCTEPPSFSGLSSVVNPGEATCSLDLSWEAAASYCGSSVTYNVYRSTSAGFVPDASTRIARGIVATAFRDAAGLALGTTYHYVVRAVDGGTGQEDGNLLVRSGTPTGSHSSFTALDEDFGSGIPGTWTVVDGGSGGGAASTWTTSNPGGRNATAPITDPFAIVDSDEAGTGATQDEQLITPVLDLSAATSVTLEFDHYFYRYESEVCDVDVRSSRTSGAWQNVGRWTGASTANPEHETLDLTSRAAGASDAQVRFRYYNGSYEWYWMVDNVRVEAESVEPCAAAGGTAAVKPVPDGRWVTGTAARASKANGDGSQVDIAWDVFTCASPDYNLYWGVASGLSACALSGAVCGMGPSGTYAWTSPSVPVGEAFIWWVLVGTDGEAMESHWGRDSAGSERHPAASNQCGFTAKSTATACP
ncbi:MAG: M28 family peptidase [Acidobacteriota bacterium]